jgi:hypothetical protein
MRDEGGEVLLDEAIEHGLVRLEQALLLVQPATLLRWHRDMYCRWWTRRSNAARKASSTLTVDTIALIREMAKANARLILPGPPCRAPRLPPGREAGPVGSRTIFPVHRDSVVTRHRQELRSIHTICLRHGNC